MWRAAYAPPQNNFVLGKYILIKGHPILNSGPESNFPLNATYCNFELGASKNILIICWFANCKKYVDQKFVFHLGAYHYFVGAIYLMRICYIY